MFMAAEYQKQDFRGNAEIHPRMYIHVISLVADV